MYANCDLFLPAKLIWLSSIVQNILSQCLYLPFFYIEELWIQIHTAKHRQLKEFTPTDQTRREEYINSRWPRSMLADNIQHWEIDFSFQIYTVIAKLIDFKRTNIIHEGNTPVGWSLNFGRYNSILTIGTKICNWRI